MKYEKFEEWMIGKKISVGGYEGVVLGRHFPSVVSSEVVCIQYKIGDNPTDWRWVELADVTFLEEVAHEEETSPIPWEVGQVVWDVRNGRGIVKEISYCEYYPIYVVFDLTDSHGDAVSDTYTLDGRYAETQKKRSLFFSEPVVTAELFPPKKPFVPTLKKGDKILIRTKSGIYPEGVVREVFSEVEDRVYTSEDGHYFMKYDIESIRILGEEIKFQ